ncbi:3,4-dihydroxy-2-butanone 4-phosphate synthase [Haloactinopolyspora alba]|uniref:3,4-dihydroxy-2-butanone 4-phosphate synthase n=1 Tax=Haloactinopolyspora alba TaxID=648780 RepID=A0A2P8DT12_9ACTN|nr:3,4-dihydroxy-2-butanone-4-phosphate synthase [Haloactinopolyspora alba]PSL00357.1 3,4-dihydroxy-2-butanone 4-phosphate synthase [Haloactinopolyspora alba]
MTSSQRRDVPPTVAGGRVFDAVEAIRRGRPVVVTDAASREDEGDLVLAAEHATPEWIAFMMDQCRGLICVPMTAERAAQLDLPPMVQNNTEPHRTAFTVSVDAAAGVTTGISARDRATTVAVLRGPASLPADLVRPGHVFPLVAAARGVTERPGHTEAAIDLVRLAGLAPMGVIVEVAGPDGEMLRGGDLAAFCRLHGLVHVSIADLVEHVTPDGSSEQVRGS